MDQATAVSIAEAMLRAILGCRFLVSGLSNIRRWPNPARTASIVFPKGAVFFGFVAMILMVVGGAGVAAGLQTRICSVMLIVFLLPTFNVHTYWLKVLPTMVPAVTNFLHDEKAQNTFGIFNRQSYHAHEVGIRDNLVLLAACIYFAVRGSGAYGLDNLIENWVIRLF